MKGLSKFNLRLGTVGNSEDTVLINHGVAAAVPICISPNYFCDAPALADRCGNTVVDQVRPSTQTWLPELGNISKANRKLERQPRYSKKEIFNVK